ncbi:MAG: hypothetical protein D3925_11945 [Candidatus Electrothrix sp. AR5]|nr:hypothetical protein [Candidatus Electrothrix sp. AR5]
MQSISYYQAKKRRVNMKSLHLTNHKVGIGLTSALFTIMIFLAISATAGTISGRVTDGSAGISSAQVYVYDATVDNYSTAGYAHTDSNGDYTVNNLPIGEYKVEFVPPYDKNYLGEWYNNKESFYNATSVAVTAPETTAGINVEVAAGGGISGRITNTDGAGVPCFFEVYDSNQNSAGYGLTDSNGDYIVTGLPKGYYKVKFNPSIYGDGSYVSEWYNNGTDFNSATAVTVIVSNTTSGIDAVLALGGAISGRVTGADGVALSSGTVEVYDSNNNYISSRYFGGGNGEYTIEGLPTGNYKILFISHDGNHANEWHNDAVSFDSAELLTVTSPDTLTDINAALAVGGGISGRVTNATGKGISHATINVFDSNQNKISFSGFPWTNPDGTYTITGLPPGNHKVLFSAPQLCYTDTWFGDKPDFASAVPVSIAASNTTENINGVLTPSGSISGRITNIAGEATPRITVSAAYSDTFGTRALAQTDGNGEYKLCGLDTASYKVHFEPREYFADKWYNNKPDFENADSVAVTAPNDTAGIDAVLAPKQTTGPVVSMTPILMLLLQK